jgi:hypothetical protein
MLEYRVNKIIDIALYLNDGTTGTALEHRFRPIKKEAIEMKTGTWRLRSHSRAGWKSHSLLPFLYINSLIEKEH